jgi:hypothetical protein
MLYFLTALKYMHICNEFEERNAYKRGLQIPAEGISARWNL